MDSNHRSRKTADLQSAPFGHSGIRPKIIEPMEGFEPTTPRLQITCSGQLSYIGLYIRTRYAYAYFQCETGANLVINFKLQKYYRIFLFNPAFFLHLLQLFY